MIRYSFVAIQKHVFIAYSYLLEHKVFKYQCYIFYKFVHVLVY